MNGETLRTSVTHPIRVDALPFDVGAGRGRLGITFAPVRGIAVLRVPVDTSAGRI